MDRYVIGLPWIARKILVSAFILPFRPQKSASAYQKIWSAEGSPLLKHSQDLVAKLRDELNAPVELAMRYGKPSLKTALASLQHQGVNHIVVAPLYPQYADSTVRTSLEAVKRLSAIKRTSTLRPFYQHAAFIKPMAAQIKTYLNDDQSHLLLSFHGLPEQHLTKSDPTGTHCLSDNCCALDSISHATCYRHQVFATAHAIANALHLKTNDYTVSFQSRLGRLPWLKPYTDQVLAELPGRGVQQLVVACPAFVADNLETLEEMGMQGRETFMAAGGKSFKLVPCLNSDRSWVVGLASLLQTHTVAASSLT